MREQDCRYYNYYVASDFRDFQFCLEENLSLRIDFGILENFIKSFRWIKL